MTVLLALRRPPITLPVWVAMAAAGVLLHELGHVWAAHVAVLLAALTWDNWQRMRGLPGLVLLR